MLEICYLTVNIVINWNKWGNHPWKQGRRYRTSTKDIAIQPQAWYRYRLYF